MTPHRPWSPRRTTARCSPGPAPWPRSSVPAGRSPRRRFCAAPTSPRRARPPGSPTPGEWSAPRTYPRCTGPGPRPGLRSHRRRAQAGVRHHDHRRPATQWRHGVAAVLRAESDDPGRRGAALVCSAALDVLNGAPGLPNPHFADDVDDALRRLPLHDQAAVPYMFRKLCASNGAAELLAECGAIDPETGTLTPLGQWARPSSHDPPLPASPGPTTSAQPGDRPGPVPAAGLAPRAAARRDHPHRTPRDHPDPVRVGRRPPARLHRRRRALRRPLLRARRLRRLRPAHPGRRPAPPRRPPVLPLRPRRLLGPHRAP